MQTPAQHVALGLVARTIAALLHKLQEYLTPLFRRKPRPLPDLAAAHYAWREGWWLGIALGTVIGWGLAIILACAL